MAREMVHIGFAQESRAHVAWRQPFTGSAGTVGRDVARDRRGNPAASRARCGGGLAADELKRRWQELARRHHPDLGGDMHAMQEINAAYTFLRPNAAQGARDLSSSQFQGKPVWAWAGHGG